MRPLTRRRFLARAAAGAAAAALAPHLTGREARGAADVKLPGGKRPNIVWISAEDLSPDLGCYGDTYATSPNLDRFAAQGVRYDRAFALAFDSRDGAALRGKNACWTSLPVNLVVSNHAWINRSGFDHGALRGNIADRKDQRAVQPGFLGGIRVHNDLIRIDLDRFSQVLFYGLSARAAFPPIQHSR